MGRILIKRGCVLTLGAKTPNFTEADLLVEDDRIAEIGPGLRARDAETIDATDTIVMPGFVDTHRHAGKTLLRNAGDLAATRATSAGSFVNPAPDDVYAATLLGLVTAVEAGVTTVVDWSDTGGDGAGGDDDALLDAMLQAHTDAGLRTVLVHATSGGSWRGDDEAWLRRRVAETPARAGSTTTFAFGAPEVAHTDAGAAWALARQLGLRIHAHARRGGWVSGLAAQGLLGGDVTLVHCAQPTGADLDAIASSGAGVSLTPANEMATGMGPPPLQQLIDRGIRPGLGVDDEMLTPGDIFTQMRAVQSLQHATLFDLKLAGKAGVPNLLSTRDVIRYATVDGARVAGLAAVTGSLEVGKQADIVLLRADRPNIAPVNDPIGAVVWGMDPSNVDWVLVAGKPLLRAGVLQVDVGRVRGLALAAAGRLAGAAGSVLESSPGAPR